MKLTPAQARAVAQAAQAYFDVCDDDEVAESLFELLDDAQFKALLKRADSASP